MVLSQLSILSLNCLITVFNQDMEKIKKFTHTNWRKELADKEFCVKGWNYGTASFPANSLRFDVNGKECWEVPLPYVAECNMGWFI